MLFVGHPDFNFLALQVLCLNHNRIECVVQKQKQPAKVKMGLQNSLRNGVDLYNNDNNLSPVLENLEVLHLGYVKLTFSNN